MRQETRQPTLWKWMAIALTALALPGSGCLPTNAARPVLKPSKKHPNIILLVTDDQRADALGAVNPLLQTPAIDGLAQAGVHFAIINQLVVSGSLLVVRAV